MSTKFNVFTGTLDIVGDSAVKYSVRLYDPLTSDLTSGLAVASPFVVDGVTVTDGDIVLFSNLGTGNNLAYRATISGGAISWSSVPVFTGTVNPAIGDSVAIQEGTLFNNQRGEFTGTTWLFNKTVRYFNGTNYSQQDALATSNLTDNTVDGTLFTVAFLGSENMKIDYSISRGGVKESGILSLTTDGSTVAIASHGAATSDAGVTFSGTISGTDLIVKYTTTSTGSPAVMKYVITRWSDSAGGPSGIPTYTSGGGSSTSAAGTSNDIQFNTAGNLAANSNFQYDPVTNILKLGGLEMSSLSTVTLNDNQVLDATAFSFPVSYTAMMVEYSISRGGNFRTGTFYISTDMTLTSFFDDYVEQGLTGVIFSCTISGGSVLVRYTSSSTGVAPSFKYFFRRWSA